MFSLNFIAIIPLAAVLSFATEEISIPLGESLGGLLNATFGNGVELIVSIVALKKNQIEVVQSSMLGSILSNLLLVMGSSFLLGGLVNMKDDSGNGTEQTFTSAMAQTTCSLLALSAASMIIPATVSSLLEPSPQRTVIQSASERTLMSTCSSTASSTARISTVKPNPSFGTHAGRPSSFLSCTPCICASSCGRTRISARGAVELPPLTRKRTSLNQ